MPSDLARHWGLDPRITFLNHGSFGATPKPVLEKQDRLRAQLESEPVRFMMRELEPLWDRARKDLADFVGADCNDIVFVNNATSGVNAVIRSMDLRSGDEILTTSHAYNACKNAIEYAAHRAGGRVTVCTLPLPVKSEDEIVDRIVSSFTKQTRVLLVDHVTSPTALVLPIERIVKEAESRGIQTLVDGAHAPGMVPVDLNALGASYYTANCHKWMCAPKGAAMLWVRRDLQDNVRPLTISHGASSQRTDKSRFLIEFDWTGTDDPTAHLCIGEAIRFVGSLVGGWDDVRRRNRALALEARSILLNVAQTEPICPESMLGSMAALRMPVGEKTPLSPIPPWARTESGEALQESLFQRGFEVPIMPFDERLIRVSAHLYNAREDYERLARALSS